MSQPGDKSQVSYPSTWGLLDANFNPNWGDSSADFLDVTSSTTVDGSEIRRSPVEGLVVYPIIYRDLYIPGGAGFLPSRVVTKIHQNEVIWTNTEVQETCFQLSRKLINAWQSPAFVGLDTFRKNASLSQQKLTANLCATALFLVNLGVFHFSFEKHSKHYEILVNQGTLDDVTSPQESSKFSNPRIPRALALGQMP